MTPDKIVSLHPTPHVAVVGGGWSGLAAACSLVQRGARVSVFEASRSWGGRARSLPEPLTLPDGTRVTLDNGQHILSGAYTATLGWLRSLGLDAPALLAAAPLDLRGPDGVGLHLPDWPPPWNVLGGVLRAQHWTWADRLALLLTAAKWRAARFTCAPDLTVADLTDDLPACVRAELTEPLCVSALNTPAHQASAAIFLRVLRDALLGGRVSARLLLPCADLGRIGPQAAAQWLTELGAALHLGVRVRRIMPQPDGTWTLRLGRAGDDLPNAQAPAGGAPQAGAAHRPWPGTFAAVVCATDAKNAASVLMESASTAPDSIALALRAWAGLAAALPHTAIATVYAWGVGARLPRPMVALRPGLQAPAQFAFDRGQLGGPPGLIAAVVSDAKGDRLALQADVLTQLQGQLGLRLQAVRTVVEKRATWACTPAARRASTRITPGLVACGDHVAGPYPATLEGAVRSAQEAVAALADIMRP